MSETVLTVVICTRDRGPMLADGVRAILAMELPPHELLVIDQSKDDLTENALRETAGDDPRVRYHRVQTVGLSAGRNAGWQLARGEVVAYTDDDCVVSSGWLAALSEELQDPSISAVFGRLLPHGEPARTGHETGFKPASERKVYSGNAPPWHVGHGGNMAFRRKDLEEVGGFDPLLGAGGALLSGEDSDIIYRLLAARKRVVYSPNALCWHKQWKPWPEQRRMERAYARGAGAQFAKYLRCGDLRGLQLFHVWMWELGVRRLAAGLFKWRSAKVMYLGYCQFLYPWLGVLASLRYRVDRKRKTYVP